MNRKNQIDQIRFLLQENGVPTFSSRMRELDNLSDDELSAVLSIVEEHKNLSYSGLWDAVWQIDYERKPVPFDEWIEDPYYSGKHTLYSVWKKELSYVLHPSSSISEFILTGSIGAGKTYASLLAQIYKIYMCSCLKSPHKFYGGEGDGGLDPNSFISFALFNVNLDNATIVNFDLISASIKSAGYWRDHCPSHTKAGSCQIFWPNKKLILRTGSSELHAIGSNLFSCVMDEANFMAKPKEKLKSEHQAEKLYNATSGRIASRFLKKGVVPGLMCIASSKADESSFVETLIRNNEGNPAFHVADYAQWDTKGRHNYSPVEFRVAVGDGYRSSEILDEVETFGSPNTFDWKLVPGKSKPVPEGMKIVRIPVDYYYKFLRDTDGQLRDTAGISTTGNDRLIWRAESIKECSVGFPYDHPFVSKVAHLPLNDDSADLSKCVNWRTLVRINNSQWTPRYFPNNPRFIHCDLGLVKDSASICMGCEYDVYKKTSVNETTGQVVETFLPKVWIDFIIRIDPTSGTEIDLVKIVNFLLNLPNMGYMVQRITFDGYASEMAVQILNKSAMVAQRSKTRNVTDPIIILSSGVLSVDRTDKPYLMLRDMMFNGTVSYYSYEPFEEEVRKLIHFRDDKKVDHPPDGTKDTSDSVAGVCYGIATAKSTPVNPPAVQTSAPESKDIETELLEATMKDYKDAKSITQLPLPPSPPLVPASGRSLVTKLFNDAL